ncbi:MAG: uroporphyrinogen-III synthase [Proteobacteria bacterium]|nr:uroporphyrinogen-III synthase [Pseudomonadota bacterium]
MSEKPKRLLITRPREDAEVLAALLLERGVEAVIEPLISVQDLDGPGLDLAGVQALLITSANGIRAFSRRQGDRDIAVFTVGDASARAARENPPTRESHAPSGRRSARHRVCAWRECRESSGEPRTSVRAN